MGRVCGSLLIPAEMLSDLLGDAVKQLHASAFSWIMRVIGMQRFAHAWG